MCNLSSYRKDLLLFAFPIAVGQLSQMLLGAGNVFVAARHSVNTVATIGVANAIIQPLFMIGCGLLSGVAPLIAQKRGRKEKTPSLFLLSSFYAIFISLIFSTMIHFIIPLIDHFGFPLNLVPEIKEYISLVGWSLVGGYLYLTVKDFLQAHEKTYMANSIAVIGVIFNFGLNFLFVFGLWGFPAMGAKGTAMATVVIRSLMGVTLFIYALLVLNIKWSFKGAYIKELIKLGVPLSFSIFLEATAFSTTAIFIGRMSVSLAAAHNIVMTVVAMIYMVPLAIANAVTVKVGKSVGEVNQLGIKSNVEAAIQLYLFLIGMVSVIFLSGPRWVVLCFTSDEVVIKLAIPLLGLATLFLLFDGLQVILSGSLRGLGRTFPTLISTFIGYWGVGIPLGLFLSLTMGMAAEGFWVGLIVSLGVVSTILSFYFLSFPFNMYFWKLNKIDHKNRYTTKEDA